jgi:hypothetical protein
MDDEPMTDEEFAALKAEIDNDIAVDHAMHDQIEAKVRRYRREEDRRDLAAGGNVTELPRRPQPSGTAPEDE